LIALRKSGLTLEEIGNEVGATRLAVFRFLIKVLTYNERLELGLPV
jgi:hypothetical protein